MGELDAVICREHLDCNKKTGAIHACGHNIQVAGMIGTAIGLVSSGVLKELDGNVEFLGVPAEEYIELEYRSQVKEEGKISFFGGKQELIYNGEIDNLDIAIMFHSLDMSPQRKKALIGGSGNGFIGKKVQFIGRESHAGSAPEEGVNALNAAMLAINNIHAQRETFKDQDNIRVHPIITKGGDISHIMPSLHPFIGGIKGNLHTRNFKMDDPYLAYIIPAKAMVLTIVDLLYDGAKLSKKIITNFKPRMSKEEYIDFLHSMSKNISE